MKKPKTIKTDSRIFKIINFYDEFVLCNLEHLKIKDIDQIKKVYHLNNGNFEPFVKNVLKEMILTRNKF